jgi:membrane-bound lytic murein transglycosylase B
MRSLMERNLLLYLITTLLLSANPVGAAEIPPVYESLVSRLHADGLGEDYLKDLFTHPRLELMPKAVAISLVRKEAELNYAQFLEEESVQRAVSYLKAHNGILEKVEDRFNISAPVVVAILCVETACGAYTGIFGTVNILVTQALSLEPEIYSQIYDQIPLNEKSNLFPEEIKRRLRKKSVRSYRELKALLTYARDHDIDPFSLKGSIEGAIGLPQFLPSNIERYGFDGDDDGMIDLFRPEDAIPSVASYLKAYNWRDEYPYGKKKEILLNYNRSDYYAATVLKLAERLACYWH